MTTHSDEAQALAGDIATSIVYTRLADLVATAKRYCEWDACPLTDEQLEQVTRALAETSDGVIDRIAGCVDARTASRLLGGS